MNSSGKDSGEVVRFMSLFAKLKDWTDDDPASLADLAQNDESILDLCKDLSWAADLLAIDEGRQRETFARPVDPKFIQAWRDYEERYQFVLADVWLNDLPDFKDTECPKLIHADSQWETADHRAEEQASAIHEAIDFAQFNVDQDWRWTEKQQEEFIGQIEEGIAAWERLKQSTGFDLKGVFRRRALIPFVLVPRKVSAKLGNAETISMLNNLQQAHDAFVFGATYAALALMRSIMEAVLRDHYKAEGKDLNERIRSARSRLPPRANEAALHRLRKLANTVLHLDREKDEGLLATDEARLEKEIIWLLIKLRALIEWVK